MSRNPNPTQQGYNGNPNLPLPNEEYEFTAEELSEYAKCMKDPIYFISTYVKIVNVDEGIVNFRPYQFQKEIIDVLEKERFVIAKLSRQSGKSTVIICGYFLWYILFHTDVSVAILANMEDTAIMLLNRLKQSFELLPRFLKQGVEKWDQKLIQLANKARVRAAATSPSAIRGDSFNLVFLDEFAHVPANIALEFMSSVFPVISSGKTTKLFIVSTPNGFNLFYKIFTEAMQGKSVFKAIQYTWRDVFYARNPGATETEALKWAEDALKAMANNRQKFQQEYECDFLGSANTLIGPWKLAQLGFTNPIETRGPLRIYKQPVRLSDEGPAHVYLVTVDVSQGQEQDSSVAQVFDITSDVFEQVAIYQDNTIKPAQFAPIVFNLCKTYNDAFVFFEINGEALLTAQLLMDDLEYENIIQVFMHKKRGQQLSMGFHQSARIGLKSSEATKRIGCTGLKSLIENDHMLLHDFDTLQQLGTFVGKLNKRGLATIYEAELGNHDDCISPLVLVGWLTAQRGFEEYVGLNVRKALMAKDSHQTDEMLFPGFFGVQEPQVVDVTPGGFEVVEDNDFWLT